MDKRWVLMESTAAEKEQVLVDELKIDGALARLLVQRGITSFDEAKAFFRPAIEDLHDPFLMQDMDRAVERLTVALEDGEKVLVFGDYDVDGTTSAALMHSFLKQLGVDVDYYIPNRYTEGYGISFQGVDYAEAAGRTLVIALDCGIKGNEKVDYAKTKGIDFIICDHHNPGAELPAAHAVLDPKRKDCNYPYKELSGCGVGFKLICGLAQTLGIAFTELEPLLDLLAISIACDIVPLTGENRVLAYYGLKRINQQPRVGVKALLQKSDRGKNIEINDLVFGVGPRINACGRIESGKKAVALLIAEDLEVAQEASRSVEEHNNDRKELDRAMANEGLALIAENDALIDRKTTVLFNPDWHKGVIGIVASRLIETYYRPTILLTENEGKVTGSARSVSGFDVYEALEQCADLLEQFGGHKYAAGLTMKRENVAAFQARFEEVVSNSITTENLTPELKIDAELELDEITPKFFRILNQLAPFGPGNRRPTFMTRELSDTGWGRIVGESHLKLNVAQDGILKFPTIAFGFGRLFHEVSKQKAFAMAYTIEENEWQGKVSLQLNAKDFKFEEAGVEVMGKANWDPFLTKFTH